jgi:hypothetical protein
MIVAFTNSPAVEVWDYESRRAVFTVPEPSYSLSFSPDSDRYRFDHQSLFRPMAAVSPAAMTPVNCAFGN